ncbi:hypothetical protein [Massilia sp. DD77]|uniref:hypothetical protein n=1 Tax=Massilia sp. DD77 TaxID=3109349 RepID=UPI002FFE140B
MAESKQPSNPTSKDGTPVNSGGEDKRSENLLPGDGGAEDGRFDVAEEVSLDQHSDEARRVGQAPSNGIADAIPESLKTPVPAQQVPDKP